MSSPDDGAGPGAGTAAAKAGGPTFLDNVCLHLASSLLGPTTVTDHLLQHAIAASTTHLYWRSPILNPLSVLQTPTSPVVSQEAQSRVVYIDLTVSFLPPSPASPPSSSSLGGPGVPRVRAKFGALLRQWHPIRLSSDTGVIDRTCRPDGGTYIQQGRYLSKRGLREYGESISIDLDSMESRPTARLLGKALGGTGLRAEVVDDGGSGSGISGSTGTCSGPSPKRVQVTMDHYHLNLCETGSFAIVDGNDETDDNMTPNDDGRIGEKAMTMLLANIEADNRRKAASAAVAAAAASLAENGSSPTKSPSATVSSVDPEEENEMRRVFEHWWDTMRRGEASSVEVERSDAGDDPTTRQSSPTKAAGGGKDIAEVASSPTKSCCSVIGEESVIKPAQLEQKAPAATAGNKEQPKKVGDPPLVNASSVGVISASAAAAGGDDSAKAASTTADAAALEAEASTSPSSAQKKKRKAPGPILVRAGGGVGGGRKKKKKGKITIGKAV